MTGCAHQGYHTPYPPTPENPSGAMSGIGPQFSWPVRGQVLAPFGAKEDGVSLKGIVIRSAEGEKVRAAQMGRVILVDEKLKGYGKTVILEHPNEFSTTYARNSEILVKVGQWVRRGDPIALGGRAGRGASPQLYFEIRRKAKAEDPKNYLPL